MNECLRLWYSTGVCENKEGVRVLWTPPTRPHSCPRAWRGEKRAGKAVERRLPVVPCNPPSYSVWAEDMFCRNGFFEKLQIKTQWGAAVQALAKLGTEQVWPNGTRVEEGLGGGAPLAVVGASVMGSQHGVFGDGCLT